MDAADATDSGGIGHWSMGGGSIRPLKGSVLLKVDPYGIIVKAKSSTLVFGDCRDLVGCDIGQLYANRRAPHIIHGMLSSGSPIEEFRQLAATEWGVLGVHRLVNGRLTFDAVLRCDDNLAVGRVVGKQIQDNLGRPLGFSHLITDVSEAYPLDRSLKTVLKPGDGGAGGQTVRLAGVNRMLVNAHRHGAAIVDGDLNVIESNTQFNMGGLHWLAIRAGVKEARLSGKPVCLTVDSQSTVVFVPLLGGEVLLLLKD
jgi:hypothetical protein